MATELKTLYFDSKGPANTDATLQCARERADALGLQNIVVASYTGETGAKAAQVFAGRNLVVVAGVVGFREPNVAAMRDDNRSAIEAAGGKIVFAGHAFGMLGRAVNRKLGGIQADEVIAHVLRLFCAGVKVTCEISCMAADAGLVQSGEEAMAIAGSGRGADTAVVLRPSNTHTFFDSKVLEIVCRPRA